MTKEKKRTNNTKLFPTDIKGFLIKFHLGSSRALKKLGKTLDYVSCFPLHFFPCSTASCVLYNRTEYS